MAGPNSKRRCLALVLWVATLQNLGCDGGYQKERHAGAIGAGAVGTVLVLIPIPVVQVVGAALIVGGAALEISVVLEDGSTQKVTHTLSTDEKQRIERGEKIQIKGSNGTIVDVQP